jgi:hypothetical protein
MPWQDLVGLIVPYYSNSINVVESTSYRTPWGVLFFNDANPAGQAPDDG